MLNPVHAKTLAIRIGEMGHMGNGTDSVQLLQLLPDLCILLRLETQTVHAAVHFQIHIKLCIRRYFGKLFQPLHLMSGMNGKAHFMLHTCK